MKKFYFKYFLGTLLLLCSTVASAHDFEVGGIYYNITDVGTVEVTYSGSSYDAVDNEYTGAVTIPSTVTYNGATYSVISIGDYAFRFCSGLTSVTIGNSVTSIGDYAFYGCSSLANVTIPNSVTTIGSKAFRGCTNLTSITIPKSVIKIEKSAFNYCDNLASIIVDYRNMTYNSRGNCNAIIETRTNTLIAGCKNTVIPNSVTTIGEWAFGCCHSIENIEIPNNVTTIGENAFNSCSNLKSVTIPNSVTTIGNYAFCGCSNLKSVTIPNSITTIGDGAFSICRSLESVTIPNSVTTIGDGAFEYCTSLTSVTIPNSVTTIGNYAFDNCTSLKVVYIEAKTPPQIGYYTFPFIETLFVPIGATDAYLSWGFWEIVEGGSCGDNATWTLRDNTLTISGTGNMYEYDYTQNRTPWDSYKFQITEIVINNGITTIGDLAFSGCSSLASVTIPNSVINIEYGAFSSCI